MFNTIKIAIISFIVLLFIGLVVYILYLKSKVSDLTIKNYNLEVSRQTLEKSLAESTRKIEVINKRNQKQNELLKKLQQQNKIEGTLEGTINNIFNNI